MAEMEIGRLSLPISISVVLALQFNLFLLVIVSVNIIGNAYNVTAAMVTDTSF